MARDRAEGDEADEAAEANEVVPDEAARAEPSWSRRSSVAMMASKAASTAGVELL